MPNFNGEKFIAQAIKSVVKQSVDCWELIIVDDNSIDNSITIIESFAVNDSRIKFFKLEENKGVSHARNFAISRANGRYIAFLDCDDIWHPLKLEKQIELMRKTNCALSYCSYSIINENNLHRGTVLLKHLTLSYNIMLKNNYIGCLTAIYDTKIVGKMYMNEELKSHEDFLLWLKILKNNNIACGCPEVLASYRVVKNSLSRSKFKQALNHWFFLRKILNISFFNSLYFFSIYSLNGIVKRIGQLNY